MAKLASSGVVLLISCRCMKTTTQSGQAWRGYERAQRGEMVKIRRIFRASDGRKGKGVERRGKKIAPRRGLLRRL